MQKEYVNSVAGQWRSVKARQNAPLTVGMGKRAGKRGALVLGEGDGLGLDVSLREAQRENVTE
jgi:hypothetical protein